MSARTRIAAVIGLVIFSILAGTTASWAYWTAQLHVTGSATHAALSVKIDGFDGAAVYSNSTLKKTGSVTITNNTVTSSTTAGAVSATLGQNSSSTLAGKVTLTAWPTSSTASCTETAAVGTGSFGGLWSSTAAGMSTSFSLTAGNSQSFCLRSVVTAGTASVTDASGTMSFTPKVSATMTVGNFTATASATATQKTVNIFPVTTLTTGAWFWLRPSYSNDTYQYCLDVSGAATSSGTIAISYGCKDSGATNQMWSFESMGNNYYRIIPRNAQSLRVDNGDSTAAGAGLSVITASANNQSQYWQAQKTNQGTIQFVNAVTGLCLSAPVGNVQNNGQVTQAECVVGDGQQWILSRTVENDAVSRTNGYSQTSQIAYTWTSIPNTPYGVQVLVNNAWVDVATTATSATGLTYRASALYAATGNTGTYTLRVIDGNGTRVATGSVTFGAIANYYSVTAATLSDMQ